MAQQTPPNPMSAPSPTTLSSMAPPLSSQILDFSHDKLRAEQQHDAIIVKKPPGHLQPIPPPNEVFQVIGLDWWGLAPEEC
ncbi:unnamed protein product [Didymodactylos carnosus]|uniref:Uncharacterized protein n=1 Tax=Didymodactylos carnosus TaxID=1234261 RepID=A0A814IZL4_9BILA|nr:unnamed protein product [Didymodactylos carnosus]CAF3801348.1 unnamed protein product [Didymodactylos carnosus]